MKHSYFYAIVFALCASISSYSCEPQAKSPKTVYSGQRSPNKNNHTPLEKKKFFDVVESEEFIKFEMLPNNKGRLYKSDNSSVEITILNCDRESEHVTQGYQEFKFQTRARITPRVMVCEYQSKTYAPIQENISEETSEESMSQ